MDGVLTCARYSFAPNYYRYCGPDANREIAAYLEEGVSDPRLAVYLSEFSVLFPYLRLIAHENGIGDPFDPRVVDAYWVGNRLLDHVGMRPFSDHLLNEQHLKKRVSAKALKWVIAKIPAGARLHHSFHVFSIFRRTGHQKIEHTVETMDSCRISWGKITESKVKSLSEPEALQSRRPKLKVMTQQLVYKDGKLHLTDGVVREVTVPVGSELGKSLKVGDWVTYHWGFVCDKVSESQVRRLAYYTNLNLRLANETV